MSSYRSPTSSTLEFAQTFITKPYSDSEEDVLEFYENFLEVNTKLKAEITKNEILEEEGKKFTIYTIWVTTSILDYNITKRYSQFHTFRENLGKVHPELNIKDLPFPEKKFFWNLEVETRLSRQAGLNDFLRELCLRSFDVPIVSFLEFLDIRTRCYFEMRKRNLFGMIRINSNTKSEEANMICTYLEKLNRNPFETSKILRDLGEYYNANKPRLGIDFNKNLLLGFNNIRGLLYFCGKYDAESNSHLICNVGLPLLLNLMSFDFNREAQIVRDIYADCKIKHIKKLNFESHLLGKTQRGCKQSALQLLDIYLESHPTTTVKEILENDLAIEEYCRWKSPRELNSRKAEKFKAIESCSPSDYSSQRKTSLTNFEERLSNSSQRTCDTYETCISPPKKSSTKPESLLEKWVEKQLSWITIPTHDSKVCKIEHENFAYIKLKVIVEGRPVDCLPYFMDNLQWIYNHVETKINLEKEMNNNYEQFDKYRMTKNEDAEYISFFSDVHIREEENKKILLNGRPLIVKDAVLPNNGILGQKSTKIELIPLVSSDGVVQTKIKILIKNLNQNSTNFWKNEFLGDPEKLEKSLLELKRLIEKKNFA